MSERAATLDRIVLSFPSLLHLARTMADSDGALRSWIQLARTGTFQSNRYGKFSITKADLAQMLSNFENITPKLPTELPIDYDHLSMDPKKPGDGIAAGWMKRLELRGDGDELWAEVEWTKTGASRIEAGEYRFISPSFVKDHTHKDGQKIGTTLLAAAVTNHPFLEGMKALTLYDFAVMGDLALTAGPDAGEPAHQHASADSPESQQNRPLHTDQSEQRLEDPMQTKTDLEKKAAGFAERVTACSNGRTLRDAISLAMAQDAEGAEAYRLVGVGAELDTEPAAAPVLSLSARPGESFDALAMRYAIEKKVPLRVAVHAVGLALPGLAEAR